LLNGQKVGDTITFDNIGYSINNPFVGTHIQNVKTRANQIGNNIFRACPVLQSFIGDSITDAGTGLLSNNPVLGNISIPNIVNLGSESLSNSPNIIFDFNFENVDNFGSNVFQNNCFIGIIGRTITVTAKTIHQISNGGNLEGDLAYLDSNNTVTFNWV